MWWFGFAHRVHARTGSTKERVFDVRPEQWTLVPPRCYRPPGSFEVRAAWRGTVTECRSTSASDPSTCVPHTRILKRIAILSEGGPTKNNSALRRRSGTQVSRYKAVSRHKIVTFHHGDLRSHFTHSHYTQAHLLLCLFPRTVFGRSGLFSESCLRGRVGGRALWGRWWGHQS